MYSTTRDRNNKLANSNASWNMFSSKITDPPNSLLTDLPTAMEYSMDRSFFMLLSNANWACKHF